MCKWTAVIKGWVDIVEVMVSVVASAAFSPSTSLFSLSSVPASNQVVHFKQQHGMVWYSQVDIKKTTTS